MTIQHPISNYTYGLKSDDVNVFISHSGIIKAILKFNKRTQIGPLIKFEIIGDTNDQVMINLSRVEF
jgi:hypothetical protein